MNKVLFIALLWLLTLRANAQIHFQSFKDIVLFADDHAYAVRSAETEVPLNREREKQAKSFLYPTLGFASGFTDNLTLQPTLVPARLFNPSAPDGSFEEMAFGKQYIYNTGVQLQWDILNFQKLFAARAAALQTEAAFATAERARYTVFNQLAATYYAIVLAQQSVQIYNQNLSVTRELEGSASEKFTTGLISEVELNLVRMQHLQNEKNLSNAQSDIEQLTRQLQSQLSTEEDIIVEEKAAPEEPAEISIETVSPEVLQQRSQVRVYEALLKQSRSLRYPSLSFLYQYNYNWATNGFMKFSEANTLPSQLLGIKLTIPLFNGFNTLGKVRESQIQLQLQRTQLENLELTVTKADEILQLQYARAYNQLEKATQILALQQKNDVHAANRYESGLISLDERMNKYNDLVERQYGYLQSLAEFSLARYKIYVRQLQYSNAGFKK